MTLLNTTSAVIRELGGSRAVARLTGRKLSAASNWHRHKAFPSNTYVAMSAALLARGLHAPAWLWGMEARPPDADPAERRNPDGAIKTRPTIEVA